MTNITLPERRKREFLPNEFTITDWNSLKQYFEELIQRPINSLSALKSWLKDRSELESVISEDLGWRYIKMTCYTDNESYRNDFQYFITEIEPNIAPLSNELDKKVLACEYKSALDYSGDKIMLRNLESNAKLFREENIPIFTEIQTEQQNYGAVCGAMSVTINDKEYTLQQAGAMLQNTDRELRKQVYQAINTRRIQDKKALDDLYTSLIQKRHQVALNAGFENFRDYMFESLGRVDYTKEDCFNFHDAIREEICPLLNTIALSRKQNLHLDSLRPYDLSVDVENKAPLKPFANGEELLQKTKQIFEAMDPFLAECLQIMEQMNRFDLESRKGKAPGGYNYPLDESGVPFIFMNAAGTLQDTITMLHEGGHAVHSILTKDLELNAYRGLTSEIAELASMSMELISMNNWNVFFNNEDDLRRAKRSHLEHALETLPWVATIDKFQHWIYENPTHSAEERTQAWNRIHNEFGLNALDWSGLQAFKDNIWQKQLHLFEVPFYYIEYGIAQLGAFGVWKNYNSDSKKALQDYKSALSLGHTVGIRDVYEAAGVKFDFSKDYIKSLVQFVKSEWEKLSN